MSTTSQPILSGRGENNLRSESFSQPGLFCLSGGLSLFLTAITLTLLISAQATITEKLSHYQNLALALNAVLLLMTIYELSFFIAGRNPSQGICRLIWIFYLLMWIEYGEYISQILPFQNVPLVAAAETFSALLLGRACLMMPYRLFADLEQPADNFNGKVWIKGRGLEILVRSAVDFLLFTTVLSLLRLQAAGWWAIYAAVHVLGCVIVTRLESDWLEICTGESKPIHPIPGELAKLVTKSGLDGVQLYGLYGQAPDGRCTSTGKTISIGLRHEVWSYATQAEVEWIFAHELGHAKSHDVLKGIVMHCGLVCLALFGYDQLLVARVEQHWEFLSNIQNFPILLLVADAGALILQPIARLHIRYQEGQADYYGIELTGTTRGIIDRTKFYSGPNPSYPSWLQTVVHNCAPLLHTHPTSREKLRMARQWESANCPRKMPRLTH